MLTRFIRALLITTVTTGGVALAIAAFRERKTPVEGHEFVLKEDELSADMQAALLDELGGHIQ